MNFVSFSQNPILLDPFCRVIVRLGLSCKAHDSTIFRQLLLSISQKVNNFSWVKSLDKIGVIDCHLKPKVESHYEFIDNFKVRFQCVINRLEEVPLPNHYRTVVSVFMVLFASQISSPQSGKFSLILEKAVQISCNDHIEINVKLFAFNFGVK